MDLTSKPLHNFQCSVNISKCPGAFRHPSTFSAFSTGTSVIDTTQELDVTVLAWAPLASGRLTSNLATSSRHPGTKSWIVKLNSRIVDGVRVLRQQRLLIATYFAKSHGMSLSRCFKTAQYLDISADDGVLVLCAYCPVSENSAGSFSLTDPHWGKPCTEQLSERQTVACLEQMKLLAEKHKKTVAQVSRMISANQWEGDVVGVWRFAFLYESKVWSCVQIYLLMSFGSIKSHWLVDMPYVIRDLALRGDKIPLLLNYCESELVIAFGWCPPWRPCNTYEKLSRFVRSRWPWIGAFARAQCPFRVHERWSRPGCP